MNEIRFYKKFLKFLELLLQRVDIEKTKEDARKIGMILFGAGFIGLMTHQVSMIPGLINVSIQSPSQSLLTGWFCWGSLTHPNRRGPSFI